MVKTRPSDMSISTEMQEYFSDLIKPLATNEEISKMFEAFKLEVIEKFEERLNKQEEKITELESTLALRDLIPSLKFRLPYLINVHQSIDPFF